ncbi:uncharacterized protein SCHCODRAFT_02689334 [Schizophyllum commune H4-8]|uniref:Fungal-type protein kinase domain-containing protein n=1 Tax=Schizophyllum commune (strain H4-8 / FGSC 9210) TaxID=578458 RepID=D8Q691_SCHCM|nr:uncharacterized protein SCHCODRAFT_02689334 [Schizophyllum commune H4-8]KAI5891051.1 hypothetical protein SCHCODRAFT_02689334 [Schizophyllum commune H4-8]
MALALDKDLEETMLWNIRGLTSHVFHDRICKTWPEAWPATLAKALLAAHFDEDAGYWRIWPSDPHMPLAHKTMAFLNGFAAIIRDHWSAQGIDTTNLPTRQWFADTSFEGRLSEAPAPDLILQDAMGPYKWEDALAIGCTTENADLPGAWHPVQTLAENAGPLMSRQRSRLYGLGIAVYRREDSQGAVLRLVGWDRMGLVVAKKFPIHDPACAEALVRVVAGTMFAPRPRLGWDASVKLRYGQEFIRVKDIDFAAAARVDEEAGVTGKGASIYVDSEEHEDGVELEVFEWTSPPPRAQLNQRATLCCSVRGPDGRMYALRRTWDDPRAPHGHKNERRMVGTLGHIEGVVDIVTSGVVESNGKPQSTDKLRGCMKAKDQDYKKFMGMSMRRHQQVLMYPFCEDLSEFESPLEVVHIFSDVLKAMGRMLKQRAMHCDISDNNVRLWRPTTGRVRGMLIDLEKGCFLDDHGQNTKEIMTGTLTFMSIGVLEHAPRKAKDDLESLVYLFILICTQYAGPRGAFRRDKGWSQCDIAVWDVLDDVHLAHKIALRRNEHGEIDRVLDDFTDPWRARCY